MRLNKPQSVEIHGLELQIHIFLTSAPEGDEWSCFTLTPHGVIIRQL